ncbi:MAG: tetratricopeptide repeat protein [Thermonemataceae bacterium]|nr:tetratricopeptide repeat protein [Thermonemataceae bacterium]
MIVHLRKIFFIVCLLSNTLNVFAQDKVIDSLEKQLNSLSAKDTNRLSTLILLGRVLSKKDLNKSFTYAQEAEKLAKSLKNEKGEANALQIMGAVEDYKANYNQAITYMEASLSINKKINSQKGVASCLNNLGNYHFKLGNYLVAIQKHSEAVVIKEKIGDEGGIITSNINIGLVYDQMKDYDKAKTYFEKALQASEKKEDYAEQQAAALFNLAALYSNEGGYQQSLAYNQKVLKIREEIGDDVHLAETYRALGEVHTNLKDYEIAKKYLDDAIKTAKEMEDRLTLAVGYSSIGDWHKAQRQYALSNEFHLKGYEIAKEIKAKHVLKDAAEDLKANFVELSDYKNANIWGKKAVEHQKEIFSEDMQKEFARAEGKLDSERKLAKEQRAKEIKEQQEAEEKQRTSNLQYSAIFIALVASFLIVVGFARKTMRSSMVENIVFFILLIFFEFILVFLDPFISVYTNGFPLFTLLANVAVALAFMPIHRSLEKVLKKKLAREKYEARLGIDIE